MRKRRGFVPGVVARLEERVVLSPGLAAEIGPRVAVPQGMQLDLRGTVAGVVSRNPSAADTFRLSGQGVVAPLGQVLASGTLTIRPVGSTTTYDGQLTLVARQGDVFVHISGIGGPSRSHPVHLRYDITGGTGPYHGATGHGVVTLGPGQPPTQMRFVLTFGDVPGPEA